MASRREIARDWGVAKSWVDKCVVLRGCPTSSLEEARKWREENTYRRAPTPRDAIARQPKEQEDNDSSEDSTLIPFVAARDLAWRGYDEILGFVLELPKNAAPQCNPLNPKLALGVLESHCTGILCAAGDVYTVWSKVGPDISTAGNTE